MSSTCATRRRLIPAAVAMTRRCSMALRPGWKQSLSSAAPTAAGRVGQVAVADAVDGGGPAVRGRQPEQHPQRGGLARAVGPQEAGDPAGPDLEAQAVNGGDSPVPLGEVVNAYHRLSFQIREPVHRLRHQPRPAAGRLASVKSPVTSLVTRSAASLMPRLVAAVPGVLLRSYGAGVDSRAAPAKPDVDLNDANSDEAQRSLCQRKCPCDHDAMASTGETASGSAPSVPGLRHDAIGLREVLFQSITDMAPGAAIAASIPAGALYAGGALPLSVLIALVACLLPPRASACWPASCPRRGRWPPMRPGGCTRRRVS